MVDRAELEATLAASFDREHLAVYGDYLQSIGDPRGELIAIDLAGGEAEHAARKRELIEAWLGEQVAALVRVVGAVEAGFVRVTATSVYVDAALRVLAGPAGDVVRAIAIAVDDVAELDRVLAAVDARPRPWLVELDVGECEGLAAVHDTLHDVAFVRQLRRLRVPSIRDETQLANLELAVSAMRADAEIVVARLYAGYDPSWRPSPRIVVPAPWPWPPPDTIGHAPLHVVVPGDPFVETIELAELVRVVERHYDDLAEPARLAWIELCALATDPACDAAFSADALARVLDPLDATDHPLVGDLRSALANRRGDRLVVRRGD